jgi:hypothetical protein
MRESEASETETSGVVRHRASIPPPTSRRRCQTRAMKMRRRTRLSIAASRGRVTSFPGPHCGRKRDARKSQAAGCQRWQVIATNSSHLP